MTKVITINCDLWKKVIGYTLWGLVGTGLTILLADGIYIFSTFEGDEFWTSYKTFFPELPMMTFDQIIYLSLFLRIIFELVYIISTFSYFNDRYEWFHVECKN